MFDLYLISFLVSSILFAMVVAYSVYQSRKSSRANLAKSLDALGESQADSEPQKEPVISKLARKRVDSLDKTDKLPAVLDNANNISELLDTSFEPTLNTQKSDKKLDSESAESSTDDVVIDGPPKFDQASSQVITELVARMKNPEAIEQQALLSLFRTHDLKFHRNVHIYGLNQLTDIWQDIEFELPSARFVELGVAIQLVDREGGMSQKELHDFQQMVLDFSNTFDAPFEFSMDLDEALEQAQLLDQVGRRYDSMAVLNVVPKNKAGFRIADLESCARDLMMSSDKNGIFLKTRGYKDNVTVLYRLACTDGSGNYGTSNSSITAVHDLVLYMNVPATENPEDVFQEMVQDATSLATWLEGKVVDRNGRAMNQRSYSVLMQQIAEISSNMRQDGLIPGDLVCKKLF